MNLKLDDENKYISIGNEKINKNLFRRDTNSKIEGNDLVKNKNKCKNNYYFIEFNNNEKIFGYFSNFNQISSEVNIISNNSNWENIFKDAFKNYSDISILEASDEDIYIYNNKLNNEINNTNKIKYKNNNSIKNFYNISNENKNFDKNKKNIKKYINIKNEIKIEDTNIILYNGF